ncbi:MAG: cheB5 [Clostridia bacterium]|nr:cheB5 [Clostridia bacterium]
MQFGKRIRVLVVDDSLLFREVLARGISSDVQIEVVATAKDPFDARDKIISYEPDVMTCDIEMPKMNGIEFIQRLMPQYPLPVIVVSTISHAVFDAIRAGAVDFVVKPDVNAVNSVENFITEMIIKIKIASAAKIVYSKPSSVLDKLNVYAKTSTNHNIIAIGASTGGTEAIYNVLRYLPEQVPGIVVVQHIPIGFSRMFAERMNTSTRLQVKEAETGDYVEKGRVLIAPGDQHMKIKKIGERYRVECYKDDKINGHCPSVDVLFESVAKEAGKKAIGVILTGMGYDGAKGLLLMREKGAKTLGQDEKSSVVYGMPKVAFNIGAVEKQVSIEHMAQMICVMIK